MPSPYAGAGIIGGIIMLGILIYNIWNHAPAPVDDRPRRGGGFNPEPGYDRPRDCDWGSEDNQENTRRRRPQGKAECAICKEPLAKTEMRFLPCRHVFHNSCITTWFQQSRTCPNCRKPA